MFSNFANFRSNDEVESNSDSDNEEAPPAKMPRVQLDDEENETSISLPQELEEYARKYFTKHFSDKIIKDKILTQCPVPSNVDKPPKLDTVSTSRS